MPMRPGHNKARAVATEHASETQRFGLGELPVKMSFPGACARPTILESGRAASDRSLQRPATGALVTRFSRLSTFEAAPLLSQSVQTNNLDNRTHVNF